MRYIPEAYAVNASVALTYGTSCRNELYKFLFRRLPMIMSRSLLFGLDLSMRNYQIR